MKNTKKSKKLAKLIKQLKEARPTAYQSYSKSVPTYFPQTWEEIWGWNDIDWKSDDIPGNR